MRHIATALLGASALFAIFAQSASAADRSVPYRPPAPRPAPAFTWTGCYLGGYVGGAWQGGDGATFTDQGQNGLGPAGSIAVPPFLSYAGGAVAARLVPAHSWNADLGSSFIGGGTLGCNWQPVNSPFVLGLEGEGGYMRLSGDAFDPRTIISTQRVLDVLGSAKIGDWYSMVTGRLGYAWDRWLLYVKGGAAFVRTEASVLDACQNTAIGCGNWLISTSDSKTVTTWTVGGGLEWAFAQSWSVKGEYMFIGLNDGSGLRTCGPVTTPSGAILAGGPFCFDHRFDGIHTAKVGLNYRFGGYGYGAY
jgi:outer membrane immunogenic protein